MRCLFADLDPNVACAGLTNEHFIPECIGGTCTSDEIICCACNHALGETIDRELAAHFEWLMVLAAAVGRASARRSKRGTSVDGPVPLKVSPGGVVDLAKIYRKYDAFGQIAAIYAPPSQADLLPLIMAKEHLSGGTETVPVTDAFEQPLMEMARRFDPLLIRAVAKVCLEVVDEIARSDGATLFNRSDPALGPVRRFIRFGSAGWIAGALTSPMVDLGDELENAYTSAGLATDNRSWFSTRIAIVSDPMSRKLFGFLQVAETMPIGCCLADDWASCGWSLLVQRELAAGTLQRHTWVVRPVVTWAQARWAAFVSRTNESVNFARRKYDEWFNRALGRVLLMVDETRRDIVEETIGWLLKPHGDGASAALAAAVITALQQRFVSNSISEADWRAVQDRIRQRLERTVDIIAADALLEAERELVSDHGVPLPSKHIGYRQ